MMLKVLEIILLFNVYCINSIPILIDDATNCQACHPLIEGKVNVHLVPHSHDDVGWLKTFSQYYYGTGSFTRYENAGVQYILSSTIKALKANPDRRFIQVETAFFWKWWQNQSNETRQDVIDLVNNGQLEMTNGAWSMNDEASTNYQSIIDQFTWGFRILENTVGKCGRPKIGWQIDPFGHSREHASIVKQLGFEGLVIGRIDYRDKAKRIQEKNLDFMWKSSSNLNDSGIFTTMFPDFYVDEYGFHFDVMYGDSVTDDNLDRKVRDFANILDNYRRYYQTANIMMPMGSDFTYQVAERNFENMDKLIEGFKNHDTYNVIYSTPSCYVQAVRNEVDTKSITLQEKEDDFFPYASENRRFWTGYFTSRPALKRFERTGNNILQSIKQLTTFSRIKDEEYDISTLGLRQAMGVLQHHDAITGTEKQQVADDYSRMLYKAIKKVEQPVGTIIENFLRKDDGNLGLKFSTCLLANVSICVNTQEENFLVAVHNPLARIVSHYVQLPVPGDNYRIVGPDGEEIYDIFDTIHDFDYLNGTASKELVFAARNLPPLGLKLYYVESLGGTSSEYKPFENITNEVYYGSEFNGFMIDGTTRNLKSVTINGIVRDISQEFLYYLTSSSGAYIFRPNDNVATAIGTQSVKCVKGNLLDQCLQVINDEINQIIRVYKDPADMYIEFDWLVGDLQYVNSYGKEIITRFTIQDFDNNNTFYTDSNGREIIKRQLNYRSDYSYDSTEEPVASNYYPVTSKILIKDEINDLRFSVLNDRSQGGTSLENGQIELMIHRRLTRDDGLGVNEVLNEQEYGRGEYARGQHYLTFGDSSSVANGISTAAFERDLAQRKLLQPWVLVSEPNTKSVTLEEFQNSLNFKFEGLKRSLPDNVHILTLEPWIDSYILRLEHVLEKDEDEDLSKPVTVDLDGLFTLFGITEIKETTLGANQFLDSNEVKDSDLIISLNPMEIRTFIIKTDQNNIGGRDDSDGDDYDSSGQNSSVISKEISVFLIVLLVFKMLV